MQRDFYGVRYSHKFIDSSRTCALTLRGTETIYDSELGYLRSWDSKRYIEFYASEG